MPGFFSLIDRWRYRFLLAVLLATFLLQPFLQGWMSGQAILVLAYGAIMAGGVHATHPERWLSALSAALAFILVGLSWYILFSESRELSVELVGVTLVFGAFTASRTLITLVSAPATDGDALAGSIFGYFLLVVVWALLFRALETWSPGAFALTAEGDAFSELLYFSLVTITTLGYGDIAPVAAFARISAGLEAATGTLYIAILIARIVGSLSGRKE